jgi:hypothetical protein
MNARIPPSLKWLIDKHARISGKMEMTQKLPLAQSVLAARLAACLSDLNGLKAELADFQKDLSGIDRTMQLHDIRVNVELIRQ